VTASYSLSDPETGGSWVQLSPSPDVDQVMPAGDGPRYVGLYGGNGSITASYEFVRFEPDELTDVAPPVTTHATSGAGPVRVTLEAADEGACASGLAKTEYRVDGGAWAEYSQPFSVSAPGAHTVEYRSTDSAGNQEATRQLSFTITTVSGGGGTTPPPPPPGGGTVQPSARAELARLPRRVTGRRLASGLRVTGTCVGVTRGTARLTASAKNARRLKLGRRAAIVARAGLRCSSGRFAATLRPTRKAGRALRRLRGRIVLRLELRMGTVRDSATLRVRGRR
jgi:hypothetical protein